MDVYTRPNLINSALLTIDTQRDTLEGRPLEVPGTSDILPTMAALLQAYRSNQMPVVHIVRVYKQDGSNVDLCRRKAVENGARVMLEGDDGCELAPQLLPDPSIRLDTDLLLSGGIQQVGVNEVIIYKPRWGAFFQTPLAGYLHDKGVRSLVFTGCNFPNCPRTSIYQASERDFTVALVQDAMSGHYPRGLRELEGIGIWVTNAEEIMQRLA